MGGFNLDHLEAARFYLFGDVKYLHFYMLLAGIDIITGISVAWQNQNLWSRKALFGYARKVLVLAVIVLANVIDQILGLDGAVTYATVLFYIANEGLSIIENLAKLGILVPANIAEKLKHIESNKKTFPEEIREEFTTEGDDK